MSINERNKLIEEIDTIVIIKNRITLKIKDYFK